MITVKKENIFISQVLGKQLYNSDEKYRLAFYVSVVNYQSETLLFNGMTRKIIKFNYDISFSDIERSQMPTEDIRTMVEDWFLVSEKTHEYNIAEQLKNFMTTLPQKSQNPIYEIFTTTDCNARCFYCFEAGMKVSDMADSTAYSLSEKIISENKCGKVKLRWFGGEPLCNIKPIDIICSKVSGANFEYASSMITNASLFSDEIIEKAIKLWHLKEVQVTLDGTESVYNRVKNYKSFGNKSPYKTVIENIEKLLDNNINVAVRLNFDLYNSDNLYQLIDFLKIRFGSQDNFFVYPYPLYENCGYKKKNRTPEERMKLIDKFIDFESYCRSLNILEKRKISDSYQLQHCMADNDRVTTITADGKLCKCPHCPEDFYGYVFKTEINFTNILDWKKRVQISQDCKECFNFFECHKIEKCPHDMICDPSFKKLAAFRLENKIIDEYKKYKETADIK